MIIRNQMCRYFYQCALFKRMHSILKCLCMFLWNTMKFYELYKETDASECKDFKLNKIL